MLLVKNSYYKLASQVFDFTHPVAFEQQVVSHMFPNDLGAVRTDSNLFGMFTKS